MKKTIALLCIFALLFAFGACKKAEQTEIYAPAGSGTSAADPTDNAGDTLTLRLIDGAGTGQLVLAGETEVCTAAAENLTVYIDGEPAEASRLKNGMLLTFDAGYTLLETWPAQISAPAVRAQSKNKDKNDYGDICGLYLQVLEDLWADDSGLNGDIEYISVDLDDAPGALTAGEKAAVAWLFAGRHGAEGLTMGFNALKDGGYINEEFLYWENGLLFSIKTSEQGKDSPEKITFDAEKWRSGTGAIFYMDCTAKRGSGPAWDSYKPGSFAIS